MLLSPHSTTMRLSWNNGFFNVKQDEINLLDKLFWVIIKKSAFKIIKETDSTSPGAWDSLKKKKERKKKRERERESGGGG